MFDKETISCHSYTDRQENINVFVLDVQVSEIVKCAMYKEYVNAVFTGNIISKPMLFQCMDNGYEWTSF
jgi:hypothetical protein